MPAAFRPGAVAALTLALAGCVVSQPIVVTYPPGATWTFTYHDAVGQEVGGGKAEVAFPGGGRLKATLTEKAFGDQARLEGKLGQATTGGWAPFSARGRWFDGRPFLYIGCVHRQRGQVAAGALALLHKREQAVKHPLRTDPCASVASRARKAPVFGEAFVDRVFSWSAQVSR